MIETIRELKLAIDSAFAEIGLSEVNAGRPDDLAWDRIVDEDRVQLCCWRETPEGRKQHVYCHLQTFPLINDLAAFAKGLIVRTCAKMVGDMTRRPVVHT